MTPANDVKHGFNCQKVIHRESGYLHSSEDDSPYDVDGVAYCGRCHMVMSVPEGRGETMSNQYSEIDQIKSEWAEAVGSDPDMLDDWPVARIVSLRILLRGIKKTIESYLEE
jgi:hypothetical protein